MSAVYEARTVPEDCQVALKLLTTTDLEDTSDKQRATRFSREAKVVSALDSPHVARVFDAGSDPRTGTMFIAMEYLEGRDLQKLLKNNRPLRPEVALRIAAQACIGLSAAHNAGFIHRDIKPGNLYLTRRLDGRITIKLLDFGIAKVLSEENPQMDLTSTGHLLGTPLYASPEQARGSRQIDLRTDLWSLGITIYHALTGVAPYQPESIFHLIAQICTAPPLPLTSVAPWVAPEIAAVIDGALKLAPEERFESAEAMLAAIESILHGDYSLDEAMLEPIEARAVRVVDAVTAEPLAPLPGRAVLPFPLEPTPPTLPPSRQGTPTPAPLEKRDRPRPRSRASWIIALALAAFGVGALGALSMRKSGWGLESMDGGAEASSRTAASAPSQATPASVTAPPIASNAPSLRVSLAVLPSDARVEIEGALVPSQKGVVSIEGAPGSIHHVRISKGTRELRADVAVTEAGALPPKLSLNDPKQKLSPNAPSPNAPSTGAAAPAQAPTATPAPTGKLRTSFE